MLEVKDLRVSFHTYAGEVRAVNGVNFTLEKGKVLAIVGESGCGKSVTAQSIMRLLPEDIAEYKSGDIIFDGENILKFSEKQVEKIRGKKIGMIFQDPMTSLNPTMTVGRQVAEVIKKNEAESGKRISRKTAFKRAIEFLKLVEIPNADTRANQFPHEFSGGMRQRVVIAMAMACSPELLIADEPTTALDVTVQAQILDLMKALQSKNDMSIIIITHDLGVVANIAQMVVVMYSGIVVEKGTVGDIYYRPKHPYTWGLLKSISRLDRKKSEPLETIEGTPPDLLNLPDGCPFADRCEYAMQICKEHFPQEYSLSEDHSCRCWLLDEECPIKIER